MDIVFVVVSHFWIGLDDGVNVEGIEHEIYVSSRPQMRTSKSFPE